MVQPHPSDGSHPHRHAELEALCHVVAARRLLEALTTGEWAPDAVVLAAITKHVDRAARWYDVAAWPQATGQYAYCPKVPSHGRAA